MGGAASRPLRARQAQGNRVLSLHTSALCPTRYPCQSRRIAALGVGRRIGRKLRLQALTYAGPQLSCASGSMLQRSQEHILHGRRTRESEDRTRTFARGRAPPDGTDRATPRGKYPVVIISSVVSDL